MAMIRMSADKMMELSNMCRKLADEYQRNMEETKEVLDWVNDVWNGAELSEYIQRLQSGCLETEKMAQTLTLLSGALSQAVESMRNAEQTAASRIRDSINL